MLDLELPVTGGPAFIAIFSARVAIKSEAVLGNRQRGNEKEDEQTTQSNPESPLRHKHLHGAMDRLKPS
jgi:hypothetical protein